MRKVSRKAITSSNFVDLAFNLPFRTNASHFFTFVGSVPNSPVSASGGSVGGSDVDMTDTRIPNLCLGDTRGSRPSPLAQLIRTIVYFAFWTVNFRL